MKLLTLFLTLLLITTNAYAEWTYYGTTVNGVWFYDKSSIKRNGNKVKVWNYVNVLPNDEEAKSLNSSSSRGLDEIDCVNETTKILLVHSFTKPNLEGEMSDATDPNPTTTYIVPDSRQAKLMQLVCKK